jgi:site-specific recombinase XerD
VVPFLSSKLSNEYKTYMLQNSAPGKTINRRLSTLRHLSKFLIWYQATDLNFMQGIENIGKGTVKKKDTSPIIDDFKAYLEAEKISQNTIKNYLSDIKQFMSWLETNNQAQSSKF